MNSAYFQLEKLFTKLYRFEHLASLADWDMNCYMPDQGSESRGEAIAAVKSYLVELITDPSVKPLIDAATKDVKQLTTKQAANLREMTHQWKLGNLLPLEFVEETARLTTRAHIVWRESKKHNDFPQFLPVLKELVINARQTATYLLNGEKRSPYEALLQQFEPGMSVDHLENVFGEVRTWLPGLLRDIVARQGETHKSVISLDGTFPVEQQRAIGHDLMKMWKFNFEAGRLDTSPHPFTGMTKEDTRITTTYRENDISYSLHAVVHETGHAKYEQNMGPRDMITQPVCAARSLGVHESQSLFAEFQIGRSAEFIRLLTPKLAQYFGPHKGFTPENVLLVWQTVKPGYIRVEADEVCYPLHVILRFEIEKALVEGTLEAEDVPRVWNEKMKEYLGLETLGRDDLGCLQDVHWSMGAFGYFPTYALGAIFAAQLMHTIKKELGAEKVSAAIASGNIDELLQKQKEKIWDNGSMYPTEELMIKATGEPLSAKYLRQHLEQRYLPKI